MEHPSVFQTMEPFLHNPMKTALINKEEQTQQIDPSPLGPQSQYVVFWIKNPHLFYYF